MSPDDETDRTPTEFGKRLFEARKARGWSQAELSARARVSEGYVSQLETGLRGARPNRDHVIRIAQAFNEPVDMWLEVAGHKIVGRPLVPAGRPSFRDFVESDPVLSREDKDTLIRMYIMMTGSAGKSTKAATKKKR